MAALTFVLYTVNSFTQDVFCLDDDVDFAGGAALTQSLGDTITLSDSSFLSLGLGKSDSLTLSDFISHAWSVQRTYADTIILSDDIVKSMAKFFDDAITLSDAFVKAIGKGIADTINL